MDWKRLGPTVMTGGIMPQVTGTYRGFKVYVSRQTRIPGRSVKEDEIVVLVHDKRVADRDGGWSTTEPAVYEKIVPRHDVVIDQITYMKYYHGFPIAIIAKPMTIGMMPKAGECVITISSGAIAVRDGGWTRHEPGVYEKVVKLNELSDSPSAIGER